MRGNPLIVGAQLYETSTQVPRAGAAFIFERTGSTWNTGTRLLAGDAAADDYFGTSVDVSGDTACVGAPNDDHSGLFNVGSVYVFARSQSGWAFQQKVVRDTGMAGQDSFGAGCGVDGDTLVASVGTILARFVAGGRIEAELPVGTATSLDVSAPNGTYVVSVRASNAVGTGPESAAVTVTVPQTVAPPGAPSGLAAIVSGSTVTFGWTAPASGPVTGYRFVAGLTPGFTSPLTTVLLSLTGTSASFPGVASGTYYVRLAASNAVGTSPSSNEVTVVVP